MGILIVVGGAIISGNVISQEQFFDRSNYIFKALKEGLAAADEVHSRTSNLPLPSIYDQGSKFLHLDRARLRKSTEDIGDSELSPLLWRGRLDSIDGFMILDQDV